LDQGKEDRKEAYLYYFALFLTNFTQYLAECQSHTKELMTIPNDMIVAKGTLTELCRKGIAYHIPWQKQRKVLGGTTRLLSFCKARTALKISWKIQLFRINSLEY
jgi:hypothetical protein